LRANRYLKEKRVENKAKSKIQKEDPFHAEYSHLEKKSEWAKGHERH